MEGPGYEDISIDTLMKIFFDVNMTVVKYPALRQNMDVIQSDRKVAYISNLWNLVELIYRSGHDEDPFFKPFIEGIVINYFDFISVNKQWYSQDFVDFITDIHDNIEE